MIPLIKYRIENILIAVSNLKKQQHVFVSGNIHNKFLAIQTNKI